MGSVSRQCQNMIARINNILTADEKLTVSLPRRRQLVAATAKARLPTFVSLTCGITRQLV